MRQIEQTIARRDDERGRGGALSRGARGGTPRKTITGAEGTGRGAFPGTFGQAGGLGAATLLLAACQILSPTPDPRIPEERSVAEADIETGRARPSRPLVVVHDDPYVDSDRVAYAGAAWLHELVEIRVSGLPLDLCLQKALAQLDEVPSVVFAHDVAQRELPVTLDHEGTFRDFLNLLAEASGLGWEEKSGALHWMAEVASTFEIHRVPGDLSWSMSTVESDRSATVQAGGGGGGGSSGGVRATPRTGGEITLNSNASFWQGLEETLIRLLGVENPAPIIDRSTGTVVVRGPAGRVREAGGYIGALNHWLARQVLLEIQLVTVTLSDSQSAGIDWQLVYQAVTDQGSPERPGSVEPGGRSGFADALARASGMDAASVGIEFGDGHAFHGTEVVLRALAAQGETSLRNSPRVVALNGQAAQMQVLNDRGILAGVDVTTRETVAVVTEVDLQPGVVSTGMSLTIVPKIVGDRVFLHAAISVSDLVSLESAGSGDQSIQLPTVERSQFFQSARLRSGETLALGGLLARRGATGSRGIVRWPWLTARSSEYSSTETVLLITPTLLDRPAPDEDLLL
ncbi:MAG: hypothetical protein OXH52_11645 [Gammaproteobacteria bacterium]|nr:hypothetical protein [Gammaproteobacteria bacterium]